MLRGILLVLTVNALALAVMGTFQKLAHASGLYFGAFIRPTMSSSRASSIIITGRIRGHGDGGGARLHFHYSHNGGQKDERHSPALFGLVATLLIAASVPLSTSRSCTILLLVPAAGFPVPLAPAAPAPRPGDRRAAFAAGVPFGGTVRHRPRRHISPGRPVIEARLDTTRQQVEDLRRHGDFGARQQLYSDTMAHGA